MRNNFLLSFVFLILMVFVISVLFKLFGFFLRVLVQFWYVWVILIFVLVLFQVIDSLRGKKNRNRHDAGDGSYIETEYRVEEEDNGRKKK
jgi:hypothetical protein